MNHTTLAILGFFIFLLGLGAYARRPTSTEPIPPAAAAGNLNLKECTIKLDSTSYAADCGTLIVPENRSRADSNLISLPVIRIRATGANPAEPIFYLNGGPGLSNMQFQPPAGLLTDHDFILVGYRGVDGGVVLDCPEITRATRGDGSDVLNERSRLGMVAASRQCAQRLQQEGIDLDGYSMEEVAADLDAGRAAFGYERINLLSASYGTRVAQIYAYQYRQHTQRSVMIGVNPPGGFIWEPATIDTQLEAYARLYAQSEHPRTPDLALMMRDVVRNMPERWLFFRIDPGKVKSLSFAMLFQRSSAALVFDAFLAAAQGDPSGLALMSLAYDFVLPGMFVYGDFYSKGVSPDFDLTRDYFNEMEPPGSIVGSPLSRLILGSAAVDGQLTWPSKQLPPELRQVQPSDVETLLVSGNLDFSTPAQNATQILLPSLTRGQQVILSDMGHVSDLLNLQPAAIERLLVSFYETGAVDDSLIQHLPMDFEVKLGFPLFAKLALAGVFLIVPAAVAVVWMVMRKIRRSRK